MSAVRAASTGTYPRTTASALSRPQRPEGRTQERASLSVVRAIVPARSVFPFFMTIVALLLIAVLAPMALNVQMAKNAYLMHNAETELAILNDHTETLRTQVQQDSSPTALEQAAKSLGMVPSGIAGVIQLKQGSIVDGDAARAAADESGASGR